MRGHGFLFNDNISFSAPRAPNTMGQRQTGTPKRRLDDDIEAIFIRACSANNVEAAADLLTVMEKWHIRRLKKYGRERRINATDLQAARRKLERLAAAHPPGGSTAPTQGTP